MVNYKDKILKYKEEYDNGRMNYWDIAKTVGCNRHYCYQVLNEDKTRETRMRYNNNHKEKLKRQKKKRILELL